MTIKLRDIPANRVSDRSPSKPQYSPESYFTSIYNSPLGRYVIVSSLQGLTCLEHEEAAQERLTKWEGEGITTFQEPDKNKIIARQLDAYFGGELTEFDVRLDLHGTDFQKHVWQALLDIPYGETRSYGDIARAIGKPKASRAVGGAIHNNPVAIRPAF